MTNNQIAYNLHNTLIARHGLRDARQILSDALAYTEVAVAEQQRKHPEDWPELKKIPPVPAVNRG